MTAADALQTQSLKGATALLADGLRAGHVYRREDLAAMSNAIDRHLRELVAMGKLEKLAQGLYHVPQKSSFGPLPPADDQVVKGFLRDKEFLVFSPSSYNTVGLGTTQRDAEAGHHFVKNQYRAVFVTQAAQAFQEARSRGHAVHVAGHWLDNDAGDALADFGEQAGDGRQVVEGAGQGVFGEVRRYARRAGYALSQQAGAGFN